jgi:twitching motility protein PilJ
MFNKTSNASAFRITAGIIAVLLVAVAGISYLQAGGGSSGARSSSSTAIVATAQAMPSIARAAANGQSGALARLRAASGRLQGAPAAGAPGRDADWQALQRGTEALLGRASALEALATARSAVDSGAAAIVAGAETLLGLSGATRELQAWQQTASALPQNLAGLASAANTDAALADIEARVTYLRSVADALAGADSGLDIAALSPNDRETVLQPLLGRIEAIESAVSSLTASAGQLGGIGADVEAIGNSATALYDAAAGSGGGSMPGFLSGPLLPVSLLVVALILIPLLMFLHSKSSVFERTAREQAAQNERNQQAILRLLDELGSLADGDLSVEATVTEDITGAIADSINYAIEKLRELVATIDRTSIMVDSAAKQTENSATHMARAADNQAREIAAATESIVSMAGSIEEVSGNAERSSDVARHSVEVAHKGGEAVRRTIDGMNTIRETIQETSKRIKRLGESSQEIGNIVELINDIAEQTNILALNASIQASMAGEAGRGFAVVADEVQRLAERSTNATKQIEVLVRTIQADTNEAVMSMERSTTDVVGGALLAENAGAALDEIEQVSNQIANLVQNISGSARQQASSAADVKRRTMKLKEIGEQTGKATATTAASISKLSLLASQLRETVAGFTLPSAALEASPIGVAQATPDSRPKKPAPPVRPIEEKAAGQG